MSYSAITLNANTHFTWNYPYVSGAVIISDINDLTVELANLEAYMPYGGNVPLGSSVMFNNLGPNSVVLMDFFGGETIATLAPGDVIKVYLTNSTDTSDIWRAVQIKGGSIGIVGLDVSASDSTITVMGSPVEAGTSGNIQVGTNSVLQSVGALNSQGILVSTTQDASNITTRTLVAGNGVAITNPDGSSGNISVALQDSISNLSALNVGSINLSTNSISTLSSNDLNITTSAATSSLNLNGVGIDTNSNITIPGSLTVQGNFVSSSIMKAWVLFTNTITTSTNIISQLAVFNVVSVTQDTQDTGYYTITFNTPFSDTNYGVLISLGSAGTPPGIAVRHGFVISKQKSNLVIVVVDASGQIVADAPNGVTIGIVSV